MKKNTSSSYNSKYLLLTSKKDINRLINSSTTEKNEIDPKVLTLVKDNSPMSSDEIYKVKNIISNKNTTRYKSPSTKEWVNSVYTYNKNYTKNLPTARNLINNMLTGYLNLTRLINNKKSNSRIIIEKRNSLNKTLVSKAETKITSDKINLTVYIYNRNKETILQRLLKDLNIIQVFRYRRKWSNSRRSFYQRWRLKLIRKLATRKLEKKIRSLDYEKIRNPIIKAKVKSDLKRAYFKLKRLGKTNRISQNYNLIGRDNRNLKNYNLRGYKRTRKLQFKNNKTIGHMAGHIQIDKANLKKTGNKINFNLTKEVIESLLRSRFNFKLNKSTKANRVGNKLRRAYRIKTAYRKKIIRNGINYIKKVREIKNKVINALCEESKFEILDSNNIRLDTNANDLITNSFSKYELKYFSNYLNAQILKKMLSLHYTREFIINNNKFKNWFMLGLKENISNLYNKKVELNIVNQKYFYLNSDIFTRALATRVRDRNNPILIEMRKALSRIPLATFRDNYFIRSSKLKKYTHLQKINKVLNKKIFSSIRYKHIQGVRIEAAGRLSKRLTAARSISKLRLIGGLKNIYETYYNINSTRLRGYVKPNVQYTNINSKTRNGAFGLKGWVGTN